MAELWKPQSREIYQSWVNALFEESSDELTEWEMNFVESIDEQLRKDRILSQRQAETLERIYTEKTK